MEYFHSSPDCPFLTRDTELHPRGDLFPIYTVILRKGGRLFGNYSSGICWCHVTSGAIWIPSLLQEPPSMTPVIYCFFLRFNDIYEGKCQLPSTQTTKMRLPRRRLPNSWPPGNLKGAGIFVYHRIQSRRWTLVMALLFLDAELLSIHFKCTLQASQSILEDLSKSNQFPCVDNDVFFISSVFSKSYSIYVLLPSPPTSLQSFWMFLVLQKLCSKCHSTIFLYCFYCTESSHVVPQ